MYISSAKLTGNPDETGWTQVHDFEPQDPSKLEARGRLFAVISARDGAVGRKILTRLNEEYYSDLSLAAFDALKNALAKVIGEFSAKDLGIGISAAGILGDVIYISVVGNSEVGVFRDGNFTRILNGKGGKVLSASGRPREGDMMVLSTSNFIGGVGEEVARTAVAADSVEQTIEAFAPQVHMKEGQGAKGLVIIKFDGEQDRKLPRPKLSLKKFSPRIFQRKLYIGRGEVGVEDVKKRKMAVSVGVILLVLLVLSIGFGIRSQSLKNSRVGFEAKVAQARHNMEEAKALFVLNPERARELFSASSILVDELLQNSSAQEVKELKKQIDQGRQVVLGEYEINLEEFLDLTLIGEKFEAEKMAATVEAVYIFDKAKKTIVEVEIGTKKTEVKVAPAQLNEVEAITAYSERIFVAENDGVFEVGGYRSKVLEKNWNGGILLYAYGGNLYILEKDTSIIWRYSVVADGFGSGKNWLAPGISVDLSRVASWAIDGSVWILTSSGHVEKYSFGSPQDISELKVFPELVRPTVVYTNEELANVYILDPESGRVVVVDKDGNYKAQYKSGVLKDAVGLAASEKEGKIIILTKDKLYSLPISH